MQSEAQLKKRVAELEKVDEQLMAAVARAVEIEILIQSKDEELQFGRVVAKEAVELCTRVAALTEELDNQKAQVEDLKRALAQVDASRETHEMWVYAVARLVVLEEFLEAGRAFEAEVESQRQLVRAAREAADQQMLTVWSPTLGFPRRTLLGMKTGHKKTRWGRMSGAAEAFRIFVNKYVCKYLFLYHGS